MFYKNKKQRHFRGKKTKVKGDKKIHPHYIVGEDQINYVSIGLTHDDKKGKKHKNHKLTKNPKLGDKSSSYLKKSIETSRKSTFTDYVFKDYQMAKEDDKYVDSLIEKKKNYLKNKK